MPVDWDAPDPQQKADPQARCAECGHWDYHHRPECGWRNWWKETVRGLPRRCSCRRFRREEL